MSCYAPCFPQLFGKLRHVRRETRRLPRLSVTQPFLVLSRNAPPHSEEERCVTRDDTKNGCVADYCHAGYGMCKFTCFSACLNARVLCLSFNMANLCRLQVTWAPHVHKGRLTVVAILKGFKKKIEQRQYITSYVSPSKPLLKFSEKNRC